MIIDGQFIASQLRAKIKAKIESLLSNKKRAPCLAVLLAGNFAASEVYVRNKQIACEECGIKSQLIRFPETVTENQILECIEELNINPEIDGILVQTPLPAAISLTKIMEAISADKDVDGFHPVNMGKLLIGDPSGFVPCTPLGIQALLQESKIEIKGKHVVILGRGPIVGKPLAALLMQNQEGANATVTVLHSKSDNLQEICRSADVIIAAIGKPLFVKESFIKPGATVIDVGINRVSDPSKKSGYRLVGDVDFEKAFPKCSFITKVPGGVGPMTIAMLLHNTLKAYFINQQMPNDH